MSSSLSGIGKLTFGLFHKINEKKRVAVCISKDLSKDGSQTEFELGIEADCSEKLLSKAKVMDFIYFNFID